jgi:tetratricopeptide (TPR) repeat protein
MNGQDNDNGGRLVPAGQRDLAEVGSANPLVSRGIADLAQGHRPQVREVACLNRKQAECYYERGDTWFFQKDYDKAIHEYNEAIRLDPTFVEAFLTRGYCWRAKGEYDKAFNDFDEAIRLEPIRGIPDDANMYQGLAADMYECLAGLFAESPDEKIRDGKRAIPLATEVCERTDWKNETALETLAAAYAAAGQFDQAVHFQTKAMETAGSNPIWLRRFADESRRRLELYKQRKPYWPRACAADRRGTGEDREGP